jgi:2',3'-cyclic-nucleotide 2'-phosphodiesterase (5'-nucleotidase family)
VNIHVPAFTRRRFLRVLGQGMTAAAIPAALWADELGAVTISILHTTDLHGHILPAVDYNDHPDLGGLARCATQIRRWQQANPHSLLIDLGDVYQGTELGWRTRGATMIRCLNALAYDGWIAGNHDFDWGMDVFAESVALSTMPVFSGNAMIEGKAVGAVDASAGELSRLRPYFLKDIAGVRLAVVTATTPALSTWLPPEYLRGLEMRDPVEALRGILQEVAAQKPDAILLAGHMGLIRSDDYANRIGAITREFPQLVACLGGHTHQNHSGDMVNGVLYTQADHYGIYAGKLDLTFDRSSRRLLHRESITVPMDQQIPLDPLVLSVAHSDLEDQQQVLAREIGELTEPFSVASTVGQPSDVERLIGSAMQAALQKRGVETDFVVHGLFDKKHMLAAGVKTVADAWDVIPYENEIVTVDLARDDLLALAREFSTGAETRPVMGGRLIGIQTSGLFQFEDLRARDGSPLPEKERYRVALNSYDSQSGGQRFPIVARLVATVSNRRVLHPIQIRDALIDFFVTRQKVGHSSLLV